MKNIYSLILLTFYAASSYSQSNTVIASKPPYVIGDYLINPENRTVSRYTEYGVKASMMKYVPDTSISYNNTTLLIMGDLIAFKENFPFECDISRLKLLSSNARYAVLKDKYAIYIYDSENIKAGSKKIDISPYRAVSDLLYQDRNDNLYLFSDELEKIIGLPELDIKTLKHIVGRYFSDKNGMYFLGRHYDYKTYTSIEKSVKLESSKGKNVKPIVTKNYLIYNSQIYAISDDIDKLNLDAGKIIEVEWSEYSNNYSITDGKNLYETSLSRYSARSEVNDRNYSNDFFRKNNISLQKIVSPNIGFRESNKELYFPIRNPKRRLQAEQRNGMLAKTTNGYYFLDKGFHTPNPEKVKNVWIYNVDLKKDEPFDVGEFKFLKDQVYIYSNRLFLEGLPVNESINTRKVRVLSRNNVKINFIFDGESLIYIGNITGYSTKIDDGQEEVILSSRIIKGTDMSKIKIVNKDLLVDDRYIYYRNTVIPMQEIGLNVKVFNE